MTTSRVVLVTGAGSGIGMACVQRFAAAGACVHGVDLKFSPEARALVTATGGQAWEADVAQVAEAARIVDGAVQQSTRLDVLVLCAGISRDRMLWSLTEEDWDKVIDVDLKGVWTYLRAAAPHLRKQKSGKVVAVSSTVALRARPGIANYAAAKAGLISLIKVAAKELGPSNINVNAVAPGFIDTPLMANVATEVRARLEQDTPLGRVGKPEDVAAVIAFLASEDARHITGEVIRVDGGMLA